MVLKVPNVRGPLETTVRRGEITLANREASDAGTEIDGAPIAPDPGLVLVAEEDPDLREILVGFLEARGRRVVALATAADVWRHLLMARFGAAVIDVRCSTSGGLGVVDELRRHEPALPIIVIASFGDVLVSRGARSLGVGEVLEKPFDLEDLDSALQRIDKRR